MSKSRRQFLAATSLTLLGAAAASLSKAQVSPDLPPGSPSAFGTGPAVGPEVTVSTFSEAEKLVQVSLSDAERVMAAASWRKTMAGLYERRTGPRKLALEATLAPASRWEPVLPGQKTLPEYNRFVRSKADPGPLPTNDEDIAFAPVTHLSRWIESRKLSSQRLTNLYLERLQRFNSAAAMCDYAHALNWRLPNPSKRMKKLLRASIGALCTAFRGELRISSTPPAFPLHTAPNLSETACPRRMAQ